MFAKHLHPLLRIDRLMEGGLIDVSELALDSYRLTKRAEQRLSLEESEGEYGLKPISDVGSGKPFDPETQRLNEIIDRLNDLYGADISDEDVMAQINHHNENQVMHGLFPKRVTEAVLDVMNDHEKLIMPLLEDEETGKQFALLILTLLAGRRPDNPYT